MMIATNSGTGYAVAGKVRAWALAELLGIPAVATSSLSLNETQLAEYEGLYELAGGKARNRPQRKWRRYPDHPLAPRRHLPRIRTPSLT